MKYNAYSEFVNKGAKELFCNKFDHFLERFFYLPVVYIKKILTILGLRHHQYCQYCGKNYFTNFKVSNNIMILLPDEYQKLDLCIDCFIKLHPYNTDILMKNIEVTTL